MILTSKLLEDIMILLIDEDVKRLQKLSWNCVSRYYCTTTPSSKNAKLQMVLFVRVNESQKEQCMNNITWQCFRDIELSTESIEFRVAPMTFQHLNTWKLLLRRRLDRRNNSGRRLNTRQTALTIKWNRTENLYCLAPPYAFACWLVYPLFSDWLFHNTSYGG